MESGSDSTYALMDLLYLLITALYMYGEQSQLVDTQNWYECYFFQQNIGASLGSCSLEQKKIP
jgi:hypothetical protein